MQNVNEVMVFSSHNIFIPWDEKLAKKKLRAKFRIQCWNTSKNKHSVESHSPKQDQAEVVGLGPWVWVIVFFAAVHGYRLGTDFVFMNAGAGILIRRARAWHCFATRTVGCVSSSLRSRCDQLFLLHRRHSPPSHISNNTFYSQKIETNTKLLYSFIFNTAIFSSIQNKQQIRFFL